MKETLPGSTPQKLVFSVALSLGLRVRTVPSGAYSICWPSELAKEKENLCDLTNTDDSCDGTVCP